ncbi:MAG: alpha/beta fold hydrolase [Tepidamorphaceae bacterium]
MATRPTSRRCWISSTAAPERCDDRLHRHHPGEDRLCRFRREPACGRCLGRCRPARKAPALLLHGGGQTRRAWDRTARDLSRAGFVAITVDQRGHGESDWLDDGSYAFADYGADAVRLGGQIAERFGTVPVVIGASLGGLAAMLAEGGGSRFLAWSRPCRHHAADGPWRRRQDSVVHGGCDGGRVCLRRGGGRRGCRLSAASPEAEVSRWSAQEPEARSRWPVPLALGPAFPEWSALDQHRWRAIGSRNERCAARDRHTRSAGARRVQRVDYTGPCRSFQGAGAACRSD